MYRICCSNKEMCVEKIQAVFPVYSQRVIFRTQVKMDTFLSNLTLRRYSVILKNGHVCWVCQGIRKT